MLTYRISNGMNDSGKSYCIIQLLLQAKILTLVKQKYKYCQSCTCELADTLVGSKCFSDIAKNRPQTKCQYLEDT